MWRARIAPYIVMSDYPDTYYRRTVFDAAAYPALTADSDVDVCVVGAGLAGLTAARELVTRGRSVAVLDAHRVGWGASGRNGGQVSSGFAADDDAVLKQVGQAHFDALYRLSIEGMEMVRETCVSLGAGAGGLSPGILKVLRYDDRAGLAAHRDRMAAYGRRFTLLDRDAVRARVNSPAYGPGLLDADAFHIHPLNYTRALAADVAARGVAVHERSRVTQLERSSDRHTVRANGAAIRARHVVMATGGYTDALVPALRRAMLPIATYMLATGPLGPRIGAAIDTTAAIIDDRRAGNYYRVLDGDRILWGSGISVRSSPPPQLAARLKRELQQVFPQLGDVPVEMAWSGLMSYARHRMPQVGQLSPGLWYCTAFGGQGLNTTAIAARLVAEAITGETDRIAAFAPFGLTWAGGVVGRAMAQATYWGYQAGDRWRERMRPV